VPARAEGVGRAGNRLRGSRRFHPHGGAYTYDWIENLLGLHMHSAESVLPEYQHPDVGDTIGLGSNRMRLERVEPEHVLAWRSEDGNWIWTFVLEEHEATTRLISRNPFRLPTLAARLGMLPMEPGSLLMERKTLGERSKSQRSLDCGAARAARSLRPLPLGTCGARAGGTFCDRAGTDPTRRRRRARRRRRGCGRDTRGRPLQALPVRGAPLARRHHPRRGRGGRESAPP
jgi:hypothetical protein